MKKHIHHEYTSEAREEISVSSESPGYHDEYFEKKNNPDPASLDHLLNKPTLWNEKCLRIVDESLIFLLENRGNMLDLWIFWDWRRSF